MKAYEVEVRISKQEDGLWRAEAPAFPGCFVDAPKVSQAIDEMQEVIAMFLDVDLERGNELPASFATRTEEPLKASIPVIIEEHQFRRLAPARKSDRKSRT